MIDFVSVAVTIAKFFARAQSEVVSPIEVYMENRAQQIVLKIPLQDTFQDDYLSVITPSLCLFSLYSISEIQCFVNNRIHSFTGSL
jgi:hypothetical protein